VTPVPKVDFRVTKASNVNGRPLKSASAQHLAQRPWFGFAARPNEAVQAKSALSSVKEKIPAAEGFDYKIQ